MENRRPSRGFGGLVYARQFKCCRFSNIQRPHTRPSPFVEVRTTLVANDAKQAPSAVPSNAQQFTNIVEIGLHDSGESPMDT